MTLSESDEADATLIGKDGDEAALQKLAQLVLVAAVQCENKQKYIEKVGALSNAVTLFCLFVVLTLIFV